MALLWIKVLVQVLVLSYELTTFLSRISKLELCYICEIFLCLSLIV